MDRTKSAPATDDDYDNETISNLLTVPLDFILSFSEVGSKGNNKEKKNTRRRLLEYKESKCMVRVRLLAFEMDALMKCTTEILIKRRMCRMYSEKVAAIVTTSEETYQELKEMRTTNNDMNNDMNNERLYHKQLLKKRPDILLKLRSLIPLLYVHGEHGFEKKILFVESETRRCLMELSKCALDLEQFAEQNFNVAENISDTLDEEGENENDDDNDDEEDNDGNTGKKSSNMKDLMMEKILVAQVEEALQSRIEALLKMSGQSSSVSSCISDDEEDESNEDNSDDVFESARDEITGKFLSMEDLCSNIYETLYEEDEEEEDEDEEEDEEDNDDDDITQQEGATLTTSSVTNTANTLFSIGREGN